MSSQSLIDRTIQLANGAEVPLDTAAMYYSVLVGHAASGEFELLHALRQACLGKPLTTEQRTSLHDEKFLDPAGAEVVPVLKQVVLAAVRGEDRSLHLDSPFVTHLDRSISEYTHSRDVIRTQIDDQVAAERFLRHDPVQRRTSAWEQRIDTGKATDHTPDR